MPTLTFTGAQQVNHDRDGMDVKFFYRLDDDPQTQFIHVVGSFNAWNLTQKEKNDYAQQLFTYTVDYIKKHWQERGSIPEMHEEIHDRFDLPILEYEKTGWSGYVLNL